MIAVENEPLRATLTNAFNDSVSILKYLIRAYLGMNNNYSKNKNNEFELSVRMPRIDSY